LTGIHLMRTGIVEANLTRLNEEEKLPYIADLIQRKVTGAEKGTLNEADFNFHRGEYERLRDKLLQAYETSPLPERPLGGEELHDLLLRLRLGVKN
ncbi:hypothetical protein, partial [Pseudomonas sp. EL_65y_Pfl1_R32]|uniref:hypothetical protein n=1 Tax=Pseudomonas sp. EL_65y_Pfl1_R32 TaxID=3088696 RepID=UPI0030DA490B